MRSIFLLSIFLLVAPALAQKNSSEIRLPANYHAAPIVSSDALHSIVDKAARNVIADKHLDPDQLAVTLIDLRDTQHLATGDYRGGERFYPASVVKLFYLAAIERELEDKQVTDTPELQRGIHDMIVSSSNEAT